MFMLNRVLAVWRAAIETSSRKEHIMRLGILVGSLALFGLTYCNGDLLAGGAKKSKHAHLHHALFELHDARHELAADKHDHGGHKQKAMLAMNDAVKHIELALISAGDNVKASPTKRDLQEHHKQYKHHPHLHHAVHELKHAHKQVKADRHPYGGHREAVLRDIHLAITEIEALLHHSGKKKK